MIDILLQEGDKIINLKIKEFFELKQLYSFLIVAILRNQDIIIPAGEDELKPNDQKWTSVVIRTKQGREILKKALKEKKFFKTKRVKKRNIINLDKNIKAVQSVHIKQLAYDKRIGKIVPHYGLSLPQVSLKKAIFINPLRAHLFKDIMMSTSEVIRRTLKLGKK